MRGLRDLVITDIKMPDMNGLKVAGKIREQRPTPIVVLSAFHDREFIDRALMEHWLIWSSQRPELKDVDRPGHATI